MQYSLDGIWIPNRVAKFGYWLELGDVISEELSVEGDEWT